MEKIIDIITKEAQKAFSDCGYEEKYGMILRAKGIVAGKEGSWIHFDFIPGEPDIREGSADITGRICVIGSKIREEKLGELFGV